MILFNYFFHLIDINWDKWLELVILFYFHTVKGATWLPNDQVISICILQARLEMFHKFLQVYGGTGFFKRLQRMGWDIYTTVYVSLYIINKFIA